MKKQNKTQLISIVMPVYNAGLYIEKTLKSILAQTHSNWELVIFNDASTDNSLEIIKKFAKKDKRIRLFQNKKRLGVSKTANLAFDKAKSTYLARMDADDIMHSKRLEKQLKFFKENKEYGVVGTQCVLIDENGKKTGHKLFPEKHENIYKMAFYSIPIQQPTAMFNLNVLPKGILHYDKHKETGEEVEVLFKIFKSVKAANLPDVLHSYRLHSENTSLKDPKKTFYITLGTRINAIFEYSYRPTLKAVLFTLTQLVMVTFIPNKYITSLYYYIRKFLTAKKSSSKRRGISSILYS